VSVSATRKNSHAEPGRSARRHTSRSLEGHRRILAQVRVLTPDNGSRRFDEFTREIRARIAERRAREREQDAQGPSGR
jgi:hypothetical protein